MLFKRFTVFSCLLVSTVSALACSQDPQYAQGVKLLEQKHYQAAIDVLQGVFERNPQCLGAKLDMAESYFLLGKREDAKQLFTSVRDIPGIPLGIRQHCDGFLQVISDSEQQQLTAQAVAEKSPPPLQVAMAFGASDNANNGVNFDTLTFTSGVLSGITLRAAEKIKPKAGTWYDVEVAAQQELPPLEGLEGTSTRGYATVTWRDHLQNDEFDLGAVRGMLELKPGEWQHQMEPRLVLSGGSIFLDGHYYRQDIALGGQIQPEVDGRKIALGYQFTDSDYQLEKVGEMDARSHRLSLSVPLTTLGEIAKLSLDAGYQWPETAERLSDYSENSVRLRLNVTPANQRYAMSASYGVSKQHDEAAYNQAFGDQKRDLKQQVLNVGLAWQANKYTTYEAKLQARQQSSAIPLFGSSAVDVTAGVRWQWD